MTASVAWAKFESVTPLGIVGEERRANPKICHLRKVASVPKQEFGRETGREESDCCGRTGRPNPASLVR
jgi:hypothetical protein